MASADNGPRSGQLGRRGNGGAKLQRTAGPSRDYLNRAARVKEVGAIL